MDKSTRASLYVLVAVLPFLVALGLARRAWLLVAAAAVAYLLALVATWVRHRAGRR